MSKINTFEKNEFLTSNAREKYKIVTESYFLYVIIYFFQWVIIKAEHWCYSTRLCHKIEQICKDGVSESGHTTFVLAKNILTWTNCIEHKRNMSKFNTFKKWLLPPIISLIAVGSTMGLFRGEVYGFKAPPNEFFTIQKLKIYKTAQYNVMSRGKPKPPSESQNSSIFMDTQLGLTLMLMS